MSEKKSTKWVCIGWEKRGHNYKCSKLTTTLQITANEAIKLFKKRFPNLRDHTATTEE